jgi:hypothetical protein
MLISLSYGRRNSLLLDCFNADGFSFTRCETDFLRYSSSNSSPTRCISFSVYYPDVYFLLSMFWAFSCPTSGAQRLQWQPLVLPLYRGDSRAVFVVGLAGRLVRPRTQHDCHHDTKVEPEAATAVIKLLMIGGGKRPKHVEL